MKRFVFAIVALSASLLAGSQAAAQVAYVAYDPVDAVCGCESPVAVTAWYAATPTYVYGDPVVMRARYRPILGGVVTRLRYVNYGYAPAYYAPGWWW